MRISIMALGIIVIGISFICIACETVVYGNGDLVTSERTVSSFDQIDIKGNVEVHFFEHEEYRVTVTTDVNLDEYTKVYTNDNKLHIGTENGNYVFTKYVVEVYCPTVTGVSISGSGQFLSDDKISTPILHINLSGSGEINLTAECNTIIAKNSGSGNMTISGISISSDITISGSGKFRGSELSVQDASVYISGSGEAQVFVTDNLNVELSGSGNLYYRGDPKTDFDISGSGVIQKI